MERYACFLVVKSARDQNGHFVSYKSYKRDIKFIDSDVAFYFSLEKFIYNFVHV